MRTAYIFFAIVTVIFSVLLVAFGIFFVAFPKMPQIQEEMMHYVGGGLVLAGVILFLVFCKLNSGQHTIVSKGSLGTVSIDEHLLKQSILRFLKEYFSGRECSCDVSLKKGRLHISAKLPNVSFVEQKQLLVRIERQLVHLLDRHFGYTEPFSFTASFQD